MTRRRWLITQVALLGTLGALAFPGEGSALVGDSLISLTATGPSPSVLTIQVVHGEVIFKNADTVTHNVAFTNLSCSGDVAPGADLSCAVPGQIGDYSYTVDGTTQANVTVAPETRTVTIRGKHHGFRLGSRVRLSGSLTAYVAGAPPSAYGPRMPVNVYARPDRNHPFHLIKVVHARPFAKAHYPARSIWVLWVRPHANTTYMVTATSQPKGGQFWANAQSKLHGVYVRHGR
ncbi:MAG TPA: hypothetical protein VGH79_08190 [Gaiellaceae bacterium]|jgi:hypothetical protein